MKTEQSRSSQQNRRSRLIRFTLLFSVALFAFAACVNDLNPEGGWSGITPQDEFLYIGSKDGRIVRVDQTTGTLDLTWQYPPDGEDDLGEIYGTPQIKDGIIYGSAFRCRGNECDGEVYAVDIETARSAWVSGTVEYETRLVGSVGIGETTLVVGTSNLGGDTDPGGYLIGLNPTVDIDAAPREQIGRTAREKWRLPLDGPVWGGITVQDDIAYFGTLEGTLYAVDLADGMSGNPADRIVWSFDAGGAITGTPHVTADKLYIGSFGDDVFALDLAHRRQNPNSNVLNSSSEWVFETGGWVWAEPLLADGILYVASLPGDVFALNADNGQPRWGEPAKAGDEIVAQPVIFESNRGPALAVPSGEENIFVVLLADGQVTGEFNTSGRGMKSSPVLIDDVLFVHTDSGQFKRFQPGTLSQLSCVEAKGEGKGCN